MVVIGKIARKEVVVKDLFEKVAGYGWSKDLDSVLMTLFYQVEIKFYSVHWVC